MEWIPVTERLPPGKNVEFYEVTVIDDYGRFIVTTAESNFGTWWTDNRLTGPNQDPLQVIAWMPLPAPYAP